MSITRVCRPQHQRMTMAGCFLCVAGLIVWTTATAFGQSAPAPASPPQPAPVLVSTSTLDMSRLAPAQFGDWDAATLPPQ